MKNNFDELHYPKNINEILNENVDEKMIDHIKRKNQEYLDTTAMKFMDESVSYYDTFAEIDKYAKALKSYGLQKGDCITLAMPNIPETIYYIYACNTIGVTAYPIDPRSTLMNMIQCINNSNSKLFICELGTYFSKVAGNTDKIPVQDIVVCSPVNMFEDKKNINSKAMIGKQLYKMKRVLNDLKANINGNNKKMFQDEFLKYSNNYIGSVDEEYDPEIPAIIVNTSGTTGTSIKGAMHSNRSYNLYSNEAQFVTDQLKRGNTYYGYIPYFSMYGSGVGMHVALSYGIVINNIPKFDGIKTLNDIIDSKTNILIGTPTVMEKLTKLYKDGGIDASHVKQYIIGGDNMAPQTLKYENDELTKLGMKRKFVYGYGATECMPVSTTNHEEYSYVDGSVGMIYPRTYIKIIDPETDKELDYNQEGEIYVSNETMMIGYLNNPEETNKVLKNIDGKTYYKTGDKGYVVESGHLYLTGRYKRMMKRPDGHQVSPIPVENAIDSNEYVNQCSVVGITRNNGIPGVIPTAFIELNENAKKQNEKDVISEIASDTLERISGERENALAYVIVDKIPNTLNGKVDFNKLQKNKFDDLDFYILEDPITIDYFQGMQGVKLIKKNNYVTRTLNKK